MTAHDLNSICPASIMLYNGEVCEDCITKGYTSCIKKKCIKNSMLKSVLGYIEKKYYDLHKMFCKIDCIISPSEFNKNQLLKGKLKCNDITVIHNFVNETEKQTTLSVTVPFISADCQEKRYIKSRRGYKQHTGCTAYNSRRRTRKRKYSSVYQRT